MRRREFVGLIYGAALALPAGAAASAAEQSLANRTSARVNTGASRKSGESARTAPG